MGWMQNNADKMTERGREMLTPLLTQGEDLSGVIYATQSKTFSAKVFVIGVTPQRLLMMEVDRKYQPKAEPVSVRPQDITKSSADGFKGGLSKFLTMDDGDIKFETAQESYKLAVLGGGMDQMFTGQGQLQGKTAFLQFLADARGLT